MYLSVLLEQKFKGCNTYYDYKQFIFENVNIKL